MKHRPQFHQLEIFLNVVETRSFAGAARSINRSQPAISQAIARLEEIYGGDLFERRRGSPLVLTQIGEAILPSARIILDIIDKQMMRAAATAQSRAGNLTLGLFPGLVGGPLRSAIGEFAAASPDVRLRLVEALPAELNRQLNERAIDLMIVALMPKLGSKTLVHERLWNERLIVALPEEHAFTRKAALSWQDIAKLPIILKESHVEIVAYRTLLDSIDREVQLNQHDVSCTTLLDMVGLGMGATLVFASGATPYAGVAFRPINEANATISVDAVWPKDDRNPLRHRLLNLIRSHKSDVTDTAAEPNSPSTGPAPDHG